MGLARILVIAGSDSSGGAGLEADQKVITAHGCYAMTATTALTAQNTLGVSDIYYTPSDFVGKLIDASLSDIGVDVVKTGMLASADTIRVVVKYLLKHKVKVIVADPVMVSTSGHQLLPYNAIRILIELLLPHCTILTPNVPEAKLLLSESGIPVSDPANVGDLISLAKSVQSLGPRYVLLKGGHLPLNKNGNLPTTQEGREIVVDVLYGEGTTTLIQANYQVSNNTHGTGCSLASAIASNLGNGMEVVQATISACRYVEAGIRTAEGLGTGNGPINHFHSMNILPFTPGRFLEYLLGRAEVQDVWKQYTEHDFVAGLGDGTLPIDSFKSYLIQDYLFLIQFSRANALSGYKAKTIDNVAAAAKTVLHIQREIALHVEYCEGFGIKKEDIEASEESQACTAYTRYTLDIGLAEDWFALQMSLAPCLIGYSKIATRLFADPKTKREGNLYWKWIENYIADDYTAAVQVGLDVLEKNAILQSPRRIEELVKIFIRATKMEIGFWNIEQ